MFLKKKKKQEKKEKLNHFLMFGCNSLETVFCYLTHMGNQ